MTFIFLIHVWNLYEKYISKEIKNIKVYHFAAKYFCGAEKNLQAYIFVFLMLVLQNSNVVRLKIESLSNCWEIRIAEGKISYILMAK